MTGLPAVPLRLLQDLSWPSLSLDLSLPPFDALKNVSPLPLPLPPLVALDLVEHANSLASPAGANETIFNLLDPSGTSERDASSHVPAVVEIPLARLVELRKSSAESCASIQRKLESKVSALDILRYFEGLQKRMDTVGLGFRLVPT